LKNKGIIAIGVILLFIFLSNQGLGILALTGDSGDSSGGGGDTGGGDTTPDLPPTGETGFMERLLDMLQSLREQFEGRFAEFFEWLRGLLGM